MDQKAAAILNAMASQQTTDSRVSKSVKIIKTGKKKPVSLLTAMFGSDLSKSVQDSRRKQFGVQNMRESRWLVVVIT